MLIKCIVALTAGLAAPKRAVVRRGFCVVPNASCSSTLGLRRHGTASAGAVHQTSVHDNMTPMLLSVAAVYVVGFVKLKPDFCRMLCLVTGNEYRTFESLTQVASSRDVGDDDGDEF